MAKAITEAKAANDSIGGVVTCVCRNVPPGWGEPCFDKLEALLAHSMLSIPATKGTPLVYSVILNCTYNNLLS
jgi:chorismate synthase